MCVWYVGPIYSSISIACVYNMLNQNLLDEQSYNFPLKSYIVVAVPWNI